jgi:hypothetical protein
MYRLFRYRLRLRLALSRLSQRLWEEGESVGEIERERESVCERERGAQPATAGGGSRRTLLPLLPLRANVAHVRQSRPDSGSSHARDPRGRQVRPRSGHAMVTRWSRGGQAVVTRWSRGKCGHRKGADGRKVLRAAVVHARLFGGVFQKSILDRFVNFWRLFPAKWLQNRPQIPKPSPGIPPRRAFCGSRAAVEHVRLHA